MNLNLPVTDMDLCRLVALIFTGGFHCLVAYIMNPMHNHIGISLTSCWFGYGGTQSLFSMEIVYKKK